MKNLSGNFIYSISIGKLLKMPLFLGIPMCWEIVGCISIPFLVLKEEAALLNDWELGLLKDGGLVLLNCWEFEFMKGGGLELLKFGELELLKFGGLESLNDGGLALLKDGGLVLLNDEELSWLLYEGRLVL